MEEGLGQPQSQEALAPAEPYRPLGRRARRVVVLLFLGILIDLVALGSDLSERALLDRIRFDNLAVREVSPP